ncbi:ANTAR domain-containing protein [Mycobacterium simiae]|uniref:ANTAR domain-containing protein n=1 Tax=Mycobacterium simiae TaxID=1784 RepID=A0A5B1BMB3_MYCSI|nr:ANTAR domain-containing protein [Mycobacterium simiae]KAA1248344.1 ANTAR domain-containing protein [Mycobacterium simiae]
MTANWVSTHISCGPNSGRILDTARGILIGLRRCPSEAAFDELFRAAQRHNVSVFAMAWALVHLAGNSGKATASFVDAQSAAREEWGQLFAGSAAPAR